MARKGLVHAKLYATLSLVEIFLSKNGSNANDGLSAAAPLRDLDGLTAVWPSVVQGPLVIRLLDEGPFSVSDGLYAFPDGAPGAPPILIQGTYAQNAGGGGAGVKTVLAIVDAAHFTVTGGGLTANFYRGYVIRRTGGAGTWTRYEITENTATTITIAMPGRNGGAINANDTFVIEEAISEIDGDAVTFETGTIPVVLDGVLFNPAGNSQHFIFEGKSPVYAAGVRVFGTIGGPTNTRLVFDDLRTFDEIETTIFGTRYPNQMPDLLGIFASTCDFAPGSCGLMRVTLVTGTGTGGGPFGGAAPDGAVDVVNDEGGTIVWVDANVACWSNLDIQLSSRLTAYTSDAAATCKITVTNGFLHCFDGGAVFLNGAVYENSIGGMTATSGGSIRLFGVTGSGTAGYGAVQRNGGSIVADSTTTVTGTIANVSAEGLPMTWTYFLSGDIASESGLTIGGVGNFIPTTRRSRAINKLRHPRGEGIQGFASAADGAAADAYIKFAASAALAAAAGLGTAPVTGVLEFIYEYPAAVPVNGASLMGWSGFGAGRGYIVDWSNVPAARFDPAAGGAAISRAITAADFSMRTHYCLTINAGNTFKLFTNGTAGAGVVNAAYVAPSNADDLYIGIRSGLNLAAAGFKLIEMAVATNALADANVPARYAEIVRQGCLPLFTGTTFHLDEEALNCFEDDKITDVQFSGLTGVITGRIGTSPWGPP